MLERRRPRSGGDRGCGHRGEHEQRDGVEGDLPVDRDAGRAREVGDRGPHRRFGHPVELPALPEAPRELGDGDGDRHRGHSAPPWDRPASAFPSARHHEEPREHDRDEGQHVHRDGGRGGGGVRDPCPTATRGRRGIRREDGEGHEEHGQRVGPRHRTVGDRQHVGGEGEAGRRRREGPPPAQRDHRDDRRARREGAEREHAQAGIETEHRRSDVREEVVRAEDGVDLAQRLQQVAEGEPRERRRGVLVAPEGHRHRSLQAEHEREHRRQHHREPPRRDLPARPSGDRVGRRRFDDRRAHLRGFNRTVGRSGAGSGSPS